MTYNSLKVSQLPQSSNVSFNDRIMILKSPASNSSVRTISVNNFITSLSLVSNTQSFSLNSNYNLINQSTLQSLFGVSVTVSSNIRYKYKISSVIHKTDNNISCNFALDGNSILSKHSYIVKSSKSNSVLSIMPVHQMSENKSSNFNVGTTITETNQNETYYNVVIEGIIDVTTEGTLTPLIGFSNSPGANSYIQSGSYMELYPFGTIGNNTIIGNWT